MPATDLAELGLRQAQFGNPLLTITYHCQLRYLYKLAQSATLYQVVVRPDKGTRGQVVWVRGDGEKVSSGE